MKNKRVEKMFLIVMSGFFLILLPCSGHAAIPQKINYQGYLTNAAGVPVNGTVQIIFSIYNAPTGGSVLWTETQNVTVTQGVYNVNLGEVTPIGLTFNDPYYLGVRVGTDPEMTPRVPLSSVGYAYRAQTVESVGSHTHSGADITTGTVSEPRIDPLIARDSEVTATVNAHATRTDNPHSTTAAQVGAVAVNQSNSITSGMIVDGQVGASDINTSQVQLRVSGSCGAGSSIRVINADGTVSCETDDVGSFNGWGLTGNAGTSPSTNFIGTTDNQELRFRVNNVVAFRVLPNATSPNIIGGYLDNWVTTGVYGATIGGGGASGVNNRVRDIYGTIAGGVNNQAGDGAGSIADCNSATVGGGADNTASGYAATVGGGEGNTASGSSATVGGGYENTASGFWATIGGGRNNIANTNDTTVGGGNNNWATGSSATVGGGYINVAGGDAAIVGGGYSNWASGYQSTVAGGSTNLADASLSTVGGGLNNFAGGGYGTISGGNNNTASGNSSTVPGGTGNVAQGDYSFAAGRRAKANTQGCFVWADSTDADLNCWNTNRFVTRAAGGYQLYTSADLSTYAWLPSGASTWSGSSDRNMKENSLPTDGKEILISLVSIPITTWNYKSQDPSIRHIGPVAQDFSAAFGLGESDKHISTIDADGVALAAIQGLYQMVKEKEKEIERIAAQNEHRVKRLEQENKELREAIRDINKRLSGIVLLGTKVAEK